MEYVNTFIEYATDLISQGGFIVGFLVIVLEAIFSILPLTAFVALNINAFGWILGFLISYSGSVVGAYLAYFIIRKFTDRFIGKWLLKKNKTIIGRGLEKFKSIKFSSLVLVLSLPFTPGSVINLLSGLAHVGKKKYLYALLISKIFVILFWGFVGKSFIDSMTNIYSMILLGIMLLVAYIISKIVNKKFNLE